MSSPAGRLTNRFQLPTRAWKTASLLTYLATVIFLYFLYSLQSALSPEVAIGIGYPVLFIMGIVVSYIYERNNPDAPPVIEMENMRLERAAKQLLGGAVVAVLIWICMLLLLQPRRVPSFETAVSVGFYSFCISAAVQELVFRWIYPQILYAGAVTSLLLFAVSHSQVGPAWIRGEFTGDSLVFFGLAVAFGAVMLVVVWIRESDVLPEDSVLKQYFTGLVVAIAAHGAYNTTVILFAFRVGPAELHPFAVDPLAAVGLLATIFLIMVVRRCFRNRFSSSGSSGSSSWRRRCRSPWILSSSTLRPTPRRTR